MVKILSVNSGSSTLKWRLFSMPEGRLLGKGLIDRINEPPAVVKIHSIEGANKKYEAYSTDMGMIVSDMLAQMKQMDLIKSLHEISGIGHRIVAGGEEFAESIVVDDKKLIQIENLVTLAPLHNAVEAKFIRIFQDVMPWSKQVAVFDSAFHQTMPPESYLYGLDYDYYTKYGVRKYGAHGTSVRYVIQKAAKMLEHDLKDLKLIVCHLGAGSSITAVKGGKSIDTSMGFTPLSGLISATRSGDVDVSLIAYLMNKLEIQSVDKMVDILNHNSGLLGISGISGDQRVLRKQIDDERCQLALDMYARRVTQYIGSYIAELNGVDAIVFTGGVGENSNPMRMQIMNNFGYIGAEVRHDVEDIQGQAINLSSDNARTQTLVIPTNEELMIAQDTYQLTQVTDKQRTVA